jgi:hypothetical protein
MNLDWTFVPLLFVVVKLKFWWNTDGGRGLLCFGAIDKCRIVDLSLVDEVGGVALLGCQKWSGPIGEKLLVSRLFGLSGRVLLSCEHFSLL